MHVMQIIENMSPGRMKHYTLWFIQITPSIPMDVRIIIKSHIGACENFKYVTHIFNTTWWGLAIVLLKQRNQILIL